MILVAIVAAAATDLIVLARNHDPARAASPSAGVRRPKTPPAVVVDDPVAHPLASAAVLPRPSRPAAAAPPPTRRLPTNSIAIPRQRVVAPVGVCQIVAGGLEPPSNVHRTCRWAGGATLDANQGTTAITGHINWVGQGTGALGNIGRLAPGNLIYTSGPGGRVVRWRVQQVVYRNKNRGVDLQAFAGPLGPRALYLISCGGRFDAAAESYVDNIYVRAVPAVAGGRPAS